ncbi:tetratricopeptide repeat protein [Aliiglaciecola litoralis]|uniref:Tetratricopeptide repeat protein n=1 Tax=Aliiglaciecola litoralis TaxID=582857 RepID=A0ABN1LG95_9ALTE
MLRLFQLRYVVLLPTLFLVFCTSTVLANTATLKKCQVTLVDKAYQEILFYYFQQDFYQALTHFEILQQACPDALKDITNPGVDPRLLKGGISLAYGLDEQAAGIFERLLEQVAEPKTQTQAWLLLGKSLFQKQQYALASQVLGNITLDSANEFLEQSDKDQWIYLQSQLFNWQQDQPDGKAADNSYWLSALSEDSIYRHYVGYNQGLAQLQSGQYQQAVATLEQLGLSKTSFFSELLQGWLSPLNKVDQSELDALRDRANLTIGYAHLQNQQALKAINAFDRVRLGSLDTDSAMLGYGWAAAQREEYQIALSAWQRLQKVPRSNEYVMESFLASAYAFEKAFAPTQAIDNLQRGLNRFATESQLIRTHLLNINDNFFLTLAQQQDWSAEVPAHLSAVMLSKTFRNQMVWLQESQQIQQQLAQWQGRLDTFSLMLDERQQETILRAQKLKENDLLAKLADYKAMRDQLEALLAQAPQSPRILNQEQELDWQQRLQGAQQSHADIIQKRQQLDQKPLNPNYAQRLSRLAGIMIWNAAENFAKRRWQAQKSLNELDKLIAQTTAQQNRLKARLVQQPEYAQQRARIANLQQTLNQQKQQNLKLQRQQLAALNQLFETKLNEQLSQLDSYKLQAQLAIVRLNDRAFRKAQADKQGGRK